MIFSHQVSRKPNALIRIQMSMPKNSTKPSAFEKSNEKRIQKPSVSQIRVTFL